MEDQDFLQRLEEERIELTNKNNELKQALSGVSYQGQEGSNLIEFQIDTGEMLGKIEHFLRGEYISIDDEGNETWAKPLKKIKVKIKKTKIVKGKRITTEKEEEKEVINHDLILFNDYGVNAVLSIIGNYIDKNTILSFYDEMRINEILADLGDELANFIYCNYEKMGMDTEFKKTRFQLTVITILHSIESTYRRALKGETFKDLNSSNIVTQSDNFNNRNSAPIKKKFHLFDKSTW